jgi:pimeloyl-ACP methyl ester carboxylesterase
MEAAIISTTQMSEHYVSRQEGGRVYYTKMGQGEPLVLLSAGSGRHFRKIADSFAPHFTCYIPDAVGHDRSDIPRRWIATRSWTMEDYVEATLEELDLMGVKRSSFIADHTGSMVALTIAADHPDRVDKLVLDGLGFWDLRRGLIIWEKFFAPSHSDTTSYDVPVTPLLPPYEDMKRTNPSLSYEEWKIDDELNRRDRRFATEHMYANSHYDMEAKAPAVQAPTLLIYGERDILRRGEQRANNAIRGSILKIVPDTPREGVPTGGVHKDKPAAFINIALEFLLKS